MSSTSQILKGLPDAKQEIGMFQDEANAIETETDTQGSVAKKAKISPIDLKSISFEQFKNYILNANEQILESLNQIKADYKDLYFIDLAIYWPDKKKEIKNFIFEFVGASIFAENNVIKGKILELLLSVTVNFDMENFEVDSFKEALLYEKPATIKEKTIEEIDHDKKDIEIFIYKNLLENLLNPAVDKLEGKNYSATLLRSFYILDRSEHSIKKDIGWKLHIAIDDRDSTNLEKGWNIVKNILIENKINTFKVVTSHAKFHKDDFQCGKQITVYQFRNPETLNFWQTLIQNIENALLEASVKADKMAPIDKRVTGSNFFSYRHDANKDGQYVSASKAESYCMNRCYDPFKNITVSSIKEETADVSQSTTSLRLNN